MSLRFVRLLSGTSESHIHGCFIPSVRNITVLVVGFQILHEQAIRFKNFYPVLRQFLKKFAGILITNSINLLHAISVRQMKNCTSIGTCGRTQFESSLSRRGKLYLNRDTNVNKDVTLIFSFEWVPVQHWQSF